MGVKVSPAELPDKETLGKLTLAIAVFESPLTVRSVVELEVVVIVPEIVDEYACSPTQLAVVPLEVKTVLAAPIEDNPVPPLFKGTVPA